MVHRSGFSVPGFCRVIRRLGASGSWVGGLWALPHRRIKSAYGGAVDSRPRGELRGRGMGGVYFPVAIGQFISLVGYGVHVGSGQRRSMGQRLYIGALTF